MSGADSTATSGDAWTLYAGSRDRFIELIRSLSEEELGRTIPLTPGWTIVQALAHVCGLNGDLASGLREGLGTDERTAEQVGSRAGMTAAEICDEWVGHGDAVKAIIDENGFLGRRLAADLVIHLHDVQHALGLPIDREDEATVDAGHTYATHTVDRWLEVTGREVAIDLDDGSWFVPAACFEPPDLILRATPYDFLRSVSGRRSRAQVEGLDWSHDPGTLLDHFSPYTELREVDVEI